MIDNLHIKPLTPFDSEEPSKNHEERFLVKLSNRFKRIISIIPYLLWVLFITIIVNIIGVIVWNKFIRKDRHEITLKEKITNIINKSK
jgi:hypothetical protein